MESVCVRADLLEDAEGLLSIRVLQVWNPLSLVTKLELVPKGEFHVGSRSLKKARKLLWLSLSAVGSRGWNLAGLALSLLLLIPLE